MTTSAVETNPRARALRFKSDQLVVELLDGRTIAVPLTWFPRLLHATTTQRAKWRIIGRGEGIHWAMLDEDLSIAGLLMCSPSPGRRRGSVARRGTCNRRS